MRLRSLVDKVEGSSVGEQGSNPGPAGGWDAGRKGNFGRFVSTTAKMQRVGIEPATSRLPH